MRILQCLLHCRRLMLKPESGYCTTRREARGARQGRQRNAKRSAKRGAKRRAKRRAGRRAKRKEKRDARRSAKPGAERSMERSTKRSEKRCRRLKHEAESAFTFPCLALYFRFMKYTLHFGFELDIVFPFLHVRFIFLLQIYDLPVWFLMYAFCFLQRNDDENKKEIPCGAVFQSSRNSFRRVFGQSQFFSWELLCAICGGMLVRGFRLSRNSFRGNLG